MGPSNVQTIASTEQNNNVVEKEDNENIIIKEWKKYDSSIKYIGKLLKNNLHGFGYYFHIGNCSYLYEGTFYCNRIEGYGNITYSNCSYFEGLFKDNKKFGPGILTDSNDFQEVAWWNGSQIIRLLQCVLPNVIPKLKRRESVLDDFNNEIKITPRRLLKVLQLNNSKILEYLHSTYNNEIKNPKSNFFNSELYDRDSNFLSGDEFSKIFDQNDDNNFTVEEMHLIELKRKLKPTENIEEEGFYINDINAYYAIANSDLLKEMASHAYLHRNRSSNILFPIRDFLIGLRLGYLKSGINENACVAFLHRCAEGNVLEAVRLYERFNLNPDVCDSNGNSGLLYATYNNQYDIVAMLCHYGADLNFFNDDGINAFVLAILKYLIIYHNLNDWNYAFFNIKPEMQDLNTEEDNHNDFEFFEYCDSIFFEKNKLFYFHDTLKSTNIKLNEVECRLETVNKYLFDLDLVRNKKLKSKKKGKKGAKNKLKKKKGMKLKSLNTEQINGECTRKILLDGFKMISGLLHLGVDPNIGTYPMPPLLMSLFVDTPDLLLLLLEFNCNPQVIWSKDNMTALHILVSQSRSSRTMYAMGKILIEKGVDLNSRTSDTHWAKEKRGIVGNYTNEDIIDEGKTALHILALRENLEDLDGSISKLVQTLVKSGASFRKKFLGHTPLSLAVLRGNAAMTQILLENGAKPGQILDYGMGKASTIYSLLRYEKTIPDVDTCIKILDHLMDYDDPLSPILTFGNVIEFYQGQHSNIKRKTKNKKTRDKKTKMMIERYLLKSSHKLVLKHYQSIVFLNLLYYSKTSSFENDFCKRIVHFLSFEEALKIVANLVYKNFISLNNKTQYSTILDVLLFVALNGFEDKKAKKIMTNDDVTKKINNLNKRSYSKVKISENNINKNNDMWNLEDRKEVPFKKKHSIEPEFDTDFAKYKVCFNCCQRFNKILLPCPDCELVYFCSQRCNKISNRKDKYHPCKLLYYKHYQNFVKDNVNNLIHGEEMIKLIKCNKTFSDYK